MNSSIQGGQNLLESHTSEFLPNGTKKWIDGPKLPKEFFGSNCALAISPNELLMAGKRNWKNLIMKLNVETEEWTEVGSLEGKVHTMAIFNNKVVIVYGDAKTVILPMRRSETSTNQLEGYLEHPVVFRKVGDLNCKERDCQKMGIVCLKGIKKLVLFNSHISHQFPIDFFHIAKSTNI